MHLLIFFIQFNIRTLDQSNRTSFALKQHTERACLLLDHQNTHGGIMILHFIKQGCRCSLENQLVSIDRNLSVVQVRF